MASRSNEGIGKEPLDELLAGRGPADASNRRAARLSAGTALSREGSAACYAAGALLAAFAVLLALPLQAQAQPAVTLVSNTGQTGISTSSSIQSQPFTGGHSGGYALTSVEVGIGTLADGGTTVRVVPNASSGQPDLSGETTFIALTAPASLAENAINTFIAPASTTPAANTTYHVYASAMNDGTRDNIQRTSSNAEDIGGAANNPPTVANAIPDQSATVGTAFSYAFPANTCAGADSSGALTYAATTADFTALPTCGRRSGDRHGVHPARAAGAGLGYEEGQRDG